MRRCGSLLACGLAVLLCLSAASAAESAVFQVNSGKDRIDANPGDTICAAANGKCTVRAGVDEANATPGVDTVRLPEGRFELTRPPDAVSSNAEGDLDLTQAMVLEGAGRSRTTIEQTVRDRVVRSLATPVEPHPGATVHGLTLTGGVASGSLNRMGGGVLVEAHHFLLDEAAIAGNVVRSKGEVTTAGAGVAMTDGHFEARQGVVRENTALMGDEGAVAHGAGIAAEGGLVTLIDSKITGNTASKTGSLEGGGLYTNVQAQVSGTTFHENRADEGGGIVLSGDLAQLLLYSGTFSENRAGTGGALFNGTQAPVDLINATLSGNKAGEGGAIFLDQGSVAIKYSTLAENEVQPGHFAIEAGSGGALLFGSVLADVAAECGGGSAFTNSGQNVIDDTSCGTGNDTVILDPLLKPLASNPGPGPGPVLKTHALKAASSAIDRVYTACPGLAPVDARGVSRPQGTFCDAGAYEREVGP